MNFLQFFCMFWFLPAEGLLLENGHSTVAELEIEIENLKAISQQYKMK